MRMAQNYEDWGGLSITSFIIQKDRSVIRSSSAQKIISDVSLSNLVK